MKITGMPYVTIICTVLAHWANSLSKSQCLFVSELLKAEVVRSHGCAIFFERDTGKISTLYDFGTI